MNPITDAVQSVWNEIHSHLQNRKDRINEEIGRYPTPIAGCDQQFNYLLEQRRQIQGEINKLRKTEFACLEADDPTIAISDFLQTSHCIDREAKKHLEALLRDRFANTDPIAVGISYER